MGVDDDAIGVDELPRTNTSFLRGSDVAGKFLEAQVIKTGSTSFSDGRKVRTLYVRIKGQTEEKSFVLNRTNTLTLATAYGAKPSDWTGRSIKLTGTKVNNPTTKQQVDGILVIAA